MAGARGKPQVRWDEEKKATVRRMYTGGSTAAEIATRIGCGCSRSAVMGLVSRLGLRRGEPQHTRLRSSYTGQSRHIKSKHFFFGRGFAPTEDCKPRVGLRDTLVTANDPVEAERVALIDLLRHHCRMPFGSGLDTTYCGRTAQAGSPYCPEHHRRCRIKPRAW